VVSREQYSLTDYQKLSGKRITKFGEAPQLAELVKQGKIPPVEQRIPKNPAVVIPIEQVGQYGGIWNRFCIKSGDGFYGPINYDPIVRWSKDASSIEPNIAESWKISTDRRTLILLLRKGIRWSDGQPFTADDVMFWYQDILLNKELTPTLPNWLTIGGELVKFRKVNDYTIELKSKDPYIFLLQELAISGRYIFAPKHYLKQFHPKYVPSAVLEDIVKKEGYNNWYQLFGVKSDYTLNPELPTIFSWKIKTPSWGKTAVLERNPYYWKIDTSGNQLPYIDEIRVHYVGNWQIAAIKLMAGEAEMHDMGIELTDYPTYMENRDKGNYKLLLYPFITVTHPALLLNQTCKDPILRSIFRDVRFRQAVSLAVNRNEINEIVFLGLCNIAQATVPSFSPLYEEEFAKAYIEYDPKEANRLLDGMGLKWDQNHKYRLRPDGKTLEITIETRQPLEWIKVGEMLPAYLEKIGIKVALQVREAAFYQMRIDANEHEAVLQGFPTHPLLIGDSNAWVLRSVNGWAPEWALWTRSMGKYGEEPPDDLKRILDLYETYKKTGDINLGKEIMRIHSKNLWIINMGGAGFPLRVVAKNNFRNLPPTKDCLTGWDYGLLGYRHPEQYFIKNP